MTTFEMLQELLAQNEFELLLPEDHTANTTEQDIRLVYQMNDTVESFLVFREAIFTGTYKKDYEGKLDASYDRDQNRYVLGVRQGDSVITLFYQKLELEVNLYNYGEIAHFWVPRHENLRQLEFRIAVLWDKYTYLGENYCSEGEKHLVHLADVPALNFCSYCAAPEPYMVPHEMPKESFLQGLDVMEQLATGREGLSAEEAAVRLQKHGPNGLAEEKRQGVFAVFFSQFKDLMVIILMITAVISFVTGSRESTIVILAVLVMNAVLGTVQHFKAEKSLQSLQAMAAPTPVPQNMMPRSASPERMAAVTFLAMSGKSTGFSS